MSGCDLSQLIFSHGVTKKAKVISEWLIFFVNINSCDHYNYFLRLGSHYIYHNIPPETYPGHIRVEILKNRSLP